MAKDIKGEIRRSQLITTYGVGSIVALGDESFMVAGIDRWDTGDGELHEPRLERRLGVSRFVLPPATESAPDIPVVRFPVWAHCPSCRRLARHRDFTSLFKNKCESCATDLVPSRFVVCCENGHIDDFPYFHWVHAGSERTDGRHDMTIETAGKTASLRDIRISCSCGKDATLEGAFAQHALDGVTRCTGQRPWLTDKEEGCDAAPRVLQRGASNVWFSTTHSAISIPPWSEVAFKVLNRHWAVLKNVPAVALEATIQGMGIAEGTPYSVADLVQTVMQRLEGASTQDPAGGSDLRRDEYQALSNGRAEQRRDQDFVCVPAEGLPPEVTRWFSRVMKVRRLREVRALQSFSRVFPAVPGEGRSVPPLAASDLGWLPAIEVRGEGVFFDVCREVLEQWEELPGVRRRVAALDQRYRERFEKFGGRPDRVITPRLVMIHTLAHELIAQWALECGYPAAALRERLYVGDDMTGFLILTATSDSAGSLGGLVGLAEPERLRSMLSEALSRSSWCSADPLCIETRAAGTDGLNMAACHACCLLPEVSCEERNVLLDRALLVGTPEEPKIGFFADALGS